MSPTPEQLEIFREGGVVYSRKMLEDAYLVVSCSYKAIHLDSNTVIDRTVYCRQRDDIYKLVNYWNSTSTPGWKYIAI